MSSMGDTNYASSEAATVTPTSTSVPSPAAATVTPTSTSAPSPAAAPTIVSEAKVSSQSSKQPYKTRSDIWLHFKKLTNSKTKCTQAVCNYCSTHYSFTSSTTTLKNHLRRCYKYPYNDDKTQTLINLQSEGKGDKTAVLAAWKFDQELCRHAYTKMVIVDELPFKFGDREGFRGFMSVAQPKFLILSRTTVAKDCLMLYTSEKTKLKDILQNHVRRVSLTTDLWTSLQNISYMCLTAHFIDDNWKLHKRIINFCVVSSHKGEAIGKSIELCLLQWGIENVATVTVDNASSNDVAVAYLKRKLIRKDGCILDGQFLHMRCCAHILNLIVRDGMNDVHCSIARIRGAIKYIRSSPARASLFKTCVTQERITCKSALVLDVSTRWNSSYMMLDSALKYQKAFERLEEVEPQFERELKDGVPTEDDWKYARVLIKFLSTFYNTSKRMSGSLYVTSNYYFHEVCAIESSISDWSKSTDPFLKTMSLKMKEKFDKYWGNIDKVNMMVMLAVVLDPCYKLKYVKFCYSKVYPKEKVSELVDRVKATMVSVFQHYQVHEYSLLLVGSSSNINDMEVDQHSDSSMKDLQSEFFKHLEAEEGIDAKSEVDKYLEESVEKQTETFQILDWWKVNSSKYPILSLIAKDVLAIPVSTVASECAFSTGGRVLDKFRSSLTPKVVECLICAQDWLRSSTTPIDIEESLEEMEELESAFENDLQIGVDD